VSCILCQPSIAWSPALDPGARDGPAATFTSSDAPSSAWSIGSDGCQKSSHTLRPIRPIGSPTATVRMRSPARVKRLSSKRPYVGR
jgi:hypothetical protein